MKIALSCIRCGKVVPLMLKIRPCQCGGTLLVQYDLEQAARTLTKQSLKRRMTSMWRYTELLPVADPHHIVSLGEGWTPLIRLRQAEGKLPLRKLWIKREEQNPTGSFKSRGISAAISVAREHGAHKVAMNSNGNAASALAAYAAYADMEAYAFLPEDCPGQIVIECMMYGAKTALVKGLIHDAGQIIHDGEQEQQWHHVGTLQEPGRVEGKKTMGFELAEQLDWKLPDVIIYPTGGGSGIIGMWLAFQQLRKLGFIDEKLPRFVSVQESGCQPLVEAMRSNKQFVPQTAETTASPTGLRVPCPPDGPLLVSILRESAGTAVAVTKQEMKQAQQSLGRLGISSSPEGAAAWAGLEQLLAQGWIGDHEEVVVFNTAHALKYVPVQAPKLPVVQAYSDWLTQVSVL